MPIQVLPSDLINKIAAGEVIERPAAVVKELVENSIDAGASRITVEIEDGGKSLIRVSDDGVGMIKEELMLAVERHTTSKIRALEDIFNISTLGFRGEALPSICSVAKVEMESKDRKMGHGGRIVIEGGKFKSLEDAGIPDGTSVLVRDLFYNVPARQKFLKNNNVETGHISSLVGRFILSRPQIKFKLVSNGKTLYQSPGSGDLFEAIVAGYGADIAKQLVEVSGASVSGYVSLPSISRVDHSFESVFVNGRYIRNALVSSAVEAQYRTLIPKGRFPIAVLFITISPRQVDVNVHPTKREVKFQNTKAVLDLVSDAVKNSLAKVGISQPDFVTSSAPEPEKIEEIGEALFEVQKKIAENIQNNTQPEIPDSIEIEVTEVQPLIALYQFQETYIVATDDVNLAIIDQHAAHERILYSKLMEQKSAAADPDISQGLLLPETLDFSLSEALIIEDHLPYLKKLGFDLASFGGRSFILRAVPAVINKERAKELLLDIIQELASGYVKQAREIKDESILKLIACHAAVKAGDKLSTKEINQLIRDLYKTGNPLTCPHGRPTIIKFSRSEFEKMFGRPSKKSVRQGDSKK